MAHRPGFILNILRDLQSRTESAAKRHQGLRHMMVLPAGENIRVPSVPGTRGVGTRFRKKRFKTCRFGETELVGPLPPRKCWPKGLEPLGAVVAEAPFAPSNRYEQEPYRIHLFFGDSPAAFKYLQRLAKSLDGIRGNSSTTQLGERCRLPGTLFYNSGDSLHDTNAARLESWLCALHWWAWFRIECPLRTRPQVVYAGKTYETDPSDDAVKSKLAFSIFDADILTASASMLSLILRYFEEPPELDLSADRTNLPKADEMLPTEVASLSEQFIEDVTIYLERERGYAPTGAAADPTTLDSPDDANPFKRIDEATGRIIEARARILRYGPALAKALKRYGFDAGGVLTVVDYAEPFGCGLESLLTSWERTKVELRGSANKLRQGKALHASGAPSAKQSAGVGHDRAKAPIAAPPDAGEAPPPNNGQECVQPTHSPDFTSVNWYGTRYSFAKGQQAESVRALWEAWEGGGHSLSQETIGDHVSPHSSRFELAKVFRRKKPGGGYRPHPAWGTLIQMETKGCYRLAPPECV